jgi:hypothetical protein
MNEDIKLNQLADELESLVGAKHLGVRTSTQFKLGVTGLAVIVNALTGARHRQDEE